MNGAWASSLDQIWRSSSLPAVAALAVAGLFALIMIVALLRADKSVANVALTVMALLAIGIAFAAGGRNFSPAAGNSQGTMQAALPPRATLPALSCIDDLAGETALAACEKLIFGAPDSVAAAVAYTGAMISRLTALGDAATAESAMTPELHAMRRAIERDRYGLVAYVLSVRDHCQPGECAAYQSLLDHNQVAANMDERVYEGLVLRYSGSWGAPGSPGTTAALPASMPTGKPTNAEFPSASSIPPVNIMTPEPAAAPRAAPAPAARPAAAANAHPAPKKPAAAKPRPQAPLQVAPVAAPPPASTDD